MEIHSVGWRRRCIEELDLVGWRRRNIEELNLVCVRRIEEVHLGCWRIRRSVEEVNLIFGSHSLEVSQVQ